MPSNFKMAFDIKAPVAQGIEHWFPKPCAHVRIMPGAPLLASHTFKR